MSIRHYKIKINFNLKLEGRNSLTNVSVIGEGIFLNLIF